MVPRNRQSWRTQQKNVRTSTTQNKQGSHTATKKKKSHKKDTTSAHKKGTCTHLDKELLDVRVTVGEEEELWLSLSKQFHDEVLLHGHANVVNQPLRRHVPVRLPVVRSDSIRFGSIWRGLLRLRYWFGSVRFGSVWLEVDSENSSFILWGFDTNFISTMTWGLFCAFLLCSVRFGSIRFGNNSLVWFWLQFPWSYDLGFVRFGSIRFDSIQK